MEHPVKAAHDFFLSPHGLAILSFILGVLIAWLVMRRRYARARRNLMKENDRLRNLTLPLLRASARAGLATVKRDKAGKPVGLILHLGAREEGNSGKTRSLNAIDDWRGLILGG